MSKFGFPTVLIQWCCELLQFLGPRRLSIMIHGRSSQGMLSLILSRLVSQSNSRMNSIGKLGLLCFDFNLGSSYFSFNFLAPVISELHESIQTWNRAWCHCGRFMP